MPNKQSNAQKAGSSHSTRKGGASYSSIHQMEHCSDPKSSARIIPLTFRQWQARHQSSRDLAFGVFLLLVYLAYLYQTALLECSTTGQNGITHVCNSDQQRREWPLLWDVVCNTTAVNIKTIGSANAGGSTSGGVKLWLWSATQLQIGLIVKAAAVNLFRASLQVVATVVGAGLLSGDIMHIIMLPLRLAALWVMCTSLPYPNIKSIARPSSNFNRRGSSASISVPATAGRYDRSDVSTSRFISWYHPSDYWRHPAVRNIIVAAQRLLPPLVVAISVDSRVMCTNWVWLDQEGSAVRQFMKYAFTGWSAPLLMLPFNLQLVFSLIEWAIVYSNSVRPKLLFSNSDTAAGLALYLEPAHLIASFILVVLLPNIVVWALEQHQRHCYQRQLQHHQQQKVPDQSGLSTPADIDPSKQSDPSSKCKVPRKSALHSRNQEGSGAATVYQAAGRAVPAAVEGGPQLELKDSGSQHPQCGSSADQSIPILQSILPAEEAAQVLAAAAAARGLAVMVYQSSTMALPVSVKVHCDHSSVSCVGPALTSALHYQLSPYNTTAAPLAITTACFRGCVQLIANVMGLKRQLARLPGGSSGRSSTADLAASLLSAVKQQIAGVDAHGASGGDSAAPALADADSSTIPSLAGKSGDPDVDVAVGDSSSSTRHVVQPGLDSAKASRGSSSSVLATNSKVQPAYTLDSCSPVCLVAGTADQAITLQVSPSDVQPDCQDLLPGLVRLLVFREAQLLVDEQKRVEGGLITHQLPAQDPGVVHLALLPATSTTPPTAVNATVGESSNGGTAIDTSQSQPPPLAATAAPFLLLPLLVLPAAAAVELQQYNEVLLAAGQGDATAPSALQSVLAVSLDVSYILSACTAATCDPGQQQVKQQMPTGVTEVLKHLLIHLASCKMFAVVQFVVATAASVFANDAPSGTTTHGEKVTTAVRVTATAAAPDGPDSPSRSSGKGKDNTSPPAAAGTSSCVCSSELLWGFRDPALEARYQAAAFSNSGLLDFINLVYMMGIGFGCYVNKGSENSNMAQQGSTSAFVRLMLSQLVIIAVALSGSVPVMLLRLRVARTVSKLAEQHQQAQLPRGQQQQPEGDRAAALNPSSAPAAVTAATSSENLDSVKQQQRGVICQAYYADQVTTQLARAARQKQVFYNVCIASAVGWLALLALSDVLVAPAYLTRLWAERSWAQDLGAIFSMAIKGYMDQVPFSSFIPVLTSLIVTHVLGCLRYGLRPLYWLAVRHVPMLVMPLVIAARQQVTGRTAFCRRNKVEVV